MYIYMNSNSYYQQNGQIYESNNLESPSSVIKGQQEIS